MFVEDLSSSPKFIGFITKGECKPEDVATERAGEYSKDYIFEN